MSNNTEQSLLSYIELCHALTVQLADCSLAKRELGRIIASMDPTNIHDVTATQKTVKTLLDVPPINPALQSKINAKEKLFKK